MGNAIYRGLPGRRLPCPRLGLASLVQSTRYPEAKTWCAVSPPLRSSEREEP